MANHIRLIAKIQTTNLKTLDAFETAISAGLEVTEKEVYFNWSHFCTSFQMNPYEKAHYAPNIGTFFESFEMNSHQVELKLTCTWRIPIPLFFWLSKRFPDIYIQTTSYDTLTVIDAQESKLTGTPVFMHLTFKNGQMVFAKGEDIAGNTM